MEPTLVSLAFWLRHPSAWSTVTVRCYCSQTCFRGTRHDRSGNCFFHVMCSLGWHNFSGATSDESAVGSGGLRPIIWFNHQCWPRSLKWSLMRYPEPNWSKEKQSGSSGSIEREMSEYFCTKQHWLQNTTQSITLTKEKNRTRYSSSRDVKPQRIIALGRVIENI